METILKAIDKLYGDQMLRIDEDWKQNLAAMGLTASTLLNPMSAQAAEPVKQVVTQRAPRAVDQLKASEMKYVKAIAGEAGNQGYVGMLAVACAIRNRAKLPYFSKDPLRGVYGLHNPVVSKYDTKVMNKAKNAWVDSLKKDTVDGAQYWGNSSDVIKWTKASAVNKKHWFNNVVFVKKVKDHLFYKEKHTHEPRRSAVKD